MRLESSLPSLLKRITKYFLAFFFVAISWAILYGIYSSMRADDIGAGWGLPLLYSVGISTLLCILAIIAQKYTSVYTIYCAIFSLSLSVFLLYKSLFEIVFVPAILGFALVVLHFTALRKKRSRN